MEQKNFYRYYRVFKNDTTISEVSCNDFMAPIHYKRGFPIRTSLEPLSASGNFEYRLLPENERYIGYLNKADAMEKAKAGALKYIEQMIKEIDSGIKKLLQYRNDHYEDLNVSLLDANIKRIKKEMNTK